MEGNEKPTSLRDLEIEFLKEKLSSFAVEEHYCFGYLDGDRETLDEFLENLQALNSTCYVLTESHCKEKNHKRFSQRGKCFSIFLVLFSISKKRVQCSGRVQNKFSAFSLNL